jgi:uncharacterized protein (TIGR03067 family)
MLCCVASWGWTMQDIVVPTLTGESALLQELAGLQGAWVSVAGRRPLQMFIANQRFTVCFGDGQLYMGRFELRVDELPRIMIMQIEEGPAKHKGQTAWCIYELEEESLRWCSAGPGSGERLIAFPDLTDARYVCSVFRRQLVPAQFGERLRKG